MRAYDVLNGLSKCLPNPTRARALRAERARVLLCYGSGIGARIFTLEIYVYRLQMRECVCECWNCTHTDVAYFVYYICMYIYDVQECYTELSLTELWGALCVFCVCVLYVYLSHTQFDANNP